MTTPRVTMVCTGNAARSVMAALLLRDRLGPSTSIGLSRGLNELWTKGGILYPPPFR